MVFQSQCCNETVISIGLTGLDRHDRRDRISFGFVGLIAVAQMQKWKATYC